MLDSHSSTSHITMVEHGTPAYEQTVALRDNVLRKPLGMRFYKKDLLTESDSIHLAYYDHDKLLGCLMLKPIKKSLYKMRQVAVDPSAQGKGVGTQLVKYSEEILQKMGVCLLVLHARDVAIPFYLRLGYQIVGESFEEIGIAHVRMHKQLV